MLLNNHKKHSLPTTFPQELEYIKHHKHPANNRHSEYFKGMNNVLDLLQTSHPKITEQLLVLKQVLKKWQQHVQQEAVIKSRQLMEMRQNLVVYVTKEIGITLEQIGYYVKHLVDHYCDEDMTKLYAQYLQAIRKLQWQQKPPPLPQKHTAAQTEQQEQQISEPPTAKSLRSNAGIFHSEATIDSPLIRYKDIDIHKYIKTKQENLDLERKMSQMASRMADLEVENKGLKREIQHLHDENMECRSDRERQLKEVAKLKHLLSQLKTEEEARHQRQQMKRTSFRYAQRRFQQCESIKNALHQSLQSLEMEIFNKQPQNEQALFGEDLIKNYYSGDKEGTHQTIKKQRRSREQGGDSSQFRMLLMQALTIQSYINRDIEQE